MFFFTFADTMNDIFKSIRPYRDNEVAHYLEELLKEEDFHAILKYFFQDHYKVYFEKLKKTQTIEDFQVLFIKPVLEQMIATSIDKLEYSGQENIPDDAACLFISNHRDIVMDPALLNLVLHYLGSQTVEIAIGGNLLIKPWIEMMVKLNRSFVVRRDIHGRELLKNSKLLSSYIHDTIINRKQHVWIAQREGRAKDGNDRTHLGILRMLNMDSGERNIALGLSKLNIVPLSISYEYDPCDILKARELMALAKGESFVKTQAEDLRSMELGMKGHKGKVHLHFSKPLNEDLTELAAKNSSDINAEIANLLDKKIHKGLKIFDTHKAAAMILHPEKKLFDIEQTAIDKMKEYISSKLKENDLDDSAFQFMALQYANPAINSLG